MAQIVLSDVSVTLGAVSIGSNCVKSVTITYNPDVLDNTGMGHTAKSRKLGLQDWSMDIEIFQDYATTALDEDLWNIMAGGGSVGAVAVLPAGAVVGASNPSYESTAAIMESYTPIAAGSVGELGVAKIKILALGAALARHVA